MRPVQLDIGGLGCHVAGAEAEGRREVRLERLISPVRCHHRQRIGQRAIFEIAGTGLQERSVPLTSKRGASACRGPTSRRSAPCCPADDRGNAASARPEPIRRPRLRLCRLGCFEAVEPRAQGGIFPFQRIEALGDFVGDRRTRHCRDAQSKTRKQCNFCDAVHGPLSPRKYRGTDSQLVVTAALEWRLRRNDRISDCPCPMQTLGVFIRAR